MKLLRPGIAWLFLLATLVAQGPHDHRESSAALHEAFGTCDESGRHWAGHAAVDADAGPDACPLCQLRHQPAALDRAATPPTPASSPAPAEPRRDLAPSLAPRRTRCRAPPRA